MYIFIPIPMPREALQTSHCTHMAVLDKRFPPTHAELARFLIIIIISIISIVLFFYHSSYSYYYQICALRRPRRAQLPRPFPSSATGINTCIQCLSLSLYIYIYIFIHLSLVGGAHNTLKFRCARRDSLSELFL